MRQRSKKLRKRVCGTLGPGCGSISYNLEGSDNIVLFYTERYPQQPLIIKGAGAGADVTASGIFADIVRIGNF